MAVMLPPIVFTFKLPFCCDGKSRFTPQVDNMLSVVINVFKIISKVRLDILSFSIYD